MQRDSRPSAVKSGSHKTECSEDINEGAEDLGRGRHSCASGEGVIREVESEPTMKLSAQRESDGIRIMQSWNNDLVKQVAEILIRINSEQRQVITRLAHFMTRHHITFWDC